MNITDLSKHSHHSYRGFGFYISKDNSGQSSMPWYAMSDQEQKLSFCVAGETKEEAKMYAEDSIDTYYEMLKRL